MKLLTDKEKERIEQEINAEHDFGTFKHFFQGEGLTDLMRYVLGNYGYDISIYITKVRGASPKKYGIDYEVAGLPLALYPQHKKTIFPVVNVEKLEDGITLMCAQILGIYQVRQAFKRQIGDVEYPDEVYNLGTTQGTTKVFKPKYC